MLCKCAAASGPLYPGALWLPKQTIPQNSRLETGAVIAASAWQRASSAARRSWVRVFRPPQHPLPARLHLREGSGGLGPSLEQGRALIGLNTPETHQQLLPGGKECEGEASHGLCDGSQPCPPPRPDLVPTSLCPPSTFLGHHSQVWDGGQGAEDNQITTETFSHEEEGFTML